MSVTAIFFNSLWGQPSLLFQAILSVGRQPARADRYPPTVEGLKLAAQTFGRDVAKLSCCTG